MAESVRLGLWHEALTRDGPGVLLRDLQRNEPDLAALAAHVRKTAPDILVLTSVDYDAGGLALKSFANLIGEGSYTHHAPLATNEGVQSGFDLDGDGETGGRADAHGYGAFPGAGALGILSRFPIRISDARAFNTLLWKDLPGSNMAMSDAGHDHLRLSTGGHWIVPIELNSDVGNPTVLTLLIGHAGPPVFDGPEDRNGRRNLDELRLWSMIVDGAFPPKPGPNAVFMANTNLDPDRGEGYRNEMAGFLQESGFQDLLSGQSTANWTNPEPMRVSYLLPSTGLTVLDAKLWPLAPDATHHLITVDLDVLSLSQP